MKFAVRENMAPGATLRERFESLARLRIQGIELTGASTIDQRDEVKELVRQTGVVPCICSGRGGAILDARRAERDLYMSDLRLALQACGDFGGVGVIVVPLLPVKMQNRPRISDLSPWKTSLQLEQALFEVLMREVAPTAEAANAAVIIEPLNRYEQWWPNRVSEGAAVAKAIGSRGIMTMADLFHMNIEEPQFVDAVKENLPFIAHVHLADSHRRLPGTGHTDFGPVLRALRDGGYDGYYGFECAVDGDPFEALPAAMRFIEVQAGGA
jgi:sugar phosphate isomerase/epimerase